VHNYLITLVDQILAAKKQPPSPLTKGEGGCNPFDKGEYPNVDTSALEMQIDEMVYKLYSLTDDEIVIARRAK